ncbi:transmembrane protein 182 [Astyanax mexicanus]|uniref:Transmembrane protein 182 n=1 Tax=Astyanax mexicanus TaxID=7994 RepID=A0A8B9LPI0_ASTMX|nr:transmembrane protein 182 [Astyanax mexicanus]KAG9271329.1 transmembrane protein 182 [Astyanax mexicanus]
MKLSVALFFAGLFGALAAVFILLSFGTDYWLLASEWCQKGNDVSEHVKRGGVLLNAPEDEGNNSTYYHEGLFWRCSFKGQVDEDSMLKFWFTNQPHSKQCIHAYLFPFPVSEQTHNATTYDSAIIFRGFWSVFVLLGVAAVILAGFVIICAAPFASHCLYKTGGALFLIAGFFLLAATVMYVIWLELMDVVDMYAAYQVAHLCPSFQLNLCYGLSFIFAPVGVFFCLLAGLLFLLIGRSVKNYQ